MQRHADQIDLSLRADKLKMDRALYPQFRELNDYRKYMRDILASYTRDSHDKSDGGNPIRFVIGDIHYVTKGISEILDRPQFVEGAALFDGELNHRIWDLKRRAKAVEPDVANG